MDVVPDGDNPEWTFKKKPDLRPDPTVENKLDSDLTPEKTTVYNQIQIRSPAYRNI